MKEWKPIELEDQVFIPFEWIDKTPGGGNLGRAEFQVCIKFKRNKVCEFWIYPRQQRDMDEFWHYKGGDCSFYIASYEDLADAKVWLIHHCLEHKAQSFHIYAPNDARFLKIDYSGIAFCKTDWNAGEEGRTP